MTSLELSAYIPVNTIEKSFPFSLNAIELSAISFELYRTVTLFPLSTKKKKKKKKTASLITITKSLP